MPQTLSGPTTDFKEVVPPRGDPYWKEVRRVAALHKADGCSWVLDFFKESCLEHDIHYRMHAWLDGTPITKEASDLRFRDVIRSRSWFGSWSPMAWGRWKGVDLFGHSSWDK